jgi:hypothetical protein
MAAKDRPCSIGAAMVGLLGFVVTISVLVVQSAAGILTFSFTLLRRVDEHAVPDLGVTLAGLAVPHAWCCSCSTWTVSRTGCGR